MRICVASGKGGTGKTTVAVNLALAVSGKGGHVQLLDCDVEGPNAHLFVDPVWRSRRSAFVAVPRVDEVKCSHCGVCSEACEFHAILVSPEKTLLVEELCHSCGACVALCPEGAIREGRKEIGIIEEGRKDNIRFVHGRLTPGQAMSPPLIRQVKALAADDCPTILDCPPGTSCPVVESVRGCDYCVVVTEPTPFGLNDLRLAVEMLDQVGIRYGVVINRCDVGTAEVDEYCRLNGITVLERIPYEDGLARLYARGVPVCEAAPEWMERFWRLWGHVVVEANGAPDGMTTGTAPLNHGR